MLDLTSIPGYTFGVLLVDARLDPFGPIGRRIIAREQAIRAAWLDLAVEAMEVDALVDDLVAGSRVPFEDVSDADRGSWVIGPDGIAQFEPFAN